MDLMQQYPGLDDLKWRAKHRVPHFVWEFLDSGTGAEVALQRNRDALDRVMFKPSALHGELDYDLSTRFLGQDHPLPFGMAPVGMSGLIWPGAERLLAAEAARSGLPYCLSTVAAQTPEHVAPVLGAHGWFQLYPPRDPDIRRDMLARAKRAGFHTLVLTVDIPMASRRERQTRSGLTQPPKMTPRILSQVMRCPRWALATLREGRPRLRMIEPYAPKAGSLPPTAHIGYLLRVAPDRDYLAALRDEWDGPLIVKGVMDPGQITGQIDGLGVDALWLSNHGARQFDGCPAAIDMLPAMRAATDLPLIFDSGIAGGLDILRALALGADFVMLGRAWHYALAALGPKGPAHLTEMLRADILSNMAQIGAQSYADLADRRA